MVGLPRRVQGSVRAARLFESPSGYALREILPADRVAFYVPRGSAHGVLLRHHSPDSLIVREVFDTRLYDPPRPVVDALAKLGRPPQILDLGGHIGVFGVFMLTIAPDAHIVSFEPDPQSCAVLWVTAQRSGRAWAVTQAAAACESGWATFAASGGPASGLRPKRASHDDHEHHTTVLTLDVLPLLRRVDLAKIDIEGGEWPILGDPRWPACAPPLLALEFHPDGCPENDYQAAAIKALDIAGMDHMLIPDTPIGAGMLWAWRRS